MTSREPAGDGGVRQATPAVPRDVAQLLARAEQAADAEFLQVGEQRLCFGEFHARVHGTAATLRRRGLQPGERVAVLLPRVIDEAVVLLAAMVAGGVAVPVHGKLKDDQVRHVLDDCRPQLVVTSGLRTIALQDPAAVLAGHRVIDVERDLVTDVATAAGPVAVELDPSSPAVLLYTSGSTGQAKAIVQTHDNLTRGAAIVARYLALDRNDHLLCLLSFSFDYGLNQLLSALHVGCRLTAADHLGVGELAYLLQTHRPTGLAGVPSLWHEVAGGLTGLTLHAEHGASLRYVTNSGGVLRPSDARVLRQRWPHVQVFAMYGLTEAFRSAFLPPAEFDAHPDSFGYAIDGVELLLVDPASGAVLDGAATGELVHAGALVAAGYWQRPAETAARYRPDPRGLTDAGQTRGTVVYSGDLVRRDTAGRHYFVARLDRMLKVQGHRVSPDEVAHAVAGMAGVGEVWVLGMDGGSNGHRIVLWVAGDPDDRELVARVQRRCRARLPSYMVPALVRVLERLPHNQNGKVDEAALRAMLAACIEPS